MKTAVNKLLIKKSVFFEYVNSPNLLDIAFYRSRLKKPQISN